MHIKKKIHLNAITCSEDWKSGICEQRLDKRIHSSHMKCLACVCLLQTTWINCLNAAWRIYTAEININLFGISIMLSWIVLASRRFHNTVLETVFDMFHFNWKREMISAAYIFFSDDLSALLVDIANYLNENKNDRWKRVISKYEFAKFQLSVASISRKKAITLKIFYLNVSIFIGTKSSGHAERLLQLLHMTW